MKVLLRRNVRKLGHIGEVVEVKSGYARNYLIPQGLAIQPSDENLRQVEREKEAYLAEVAKLREELQVRADMLNGKEVTIPARANAEGHLYGSVGPAQIAAAMAEQDMIVHADEIIMSEPIRQLDKHEVKIELEEDVEATIHVWVVPIREIGEDGQEIPHPTELSQETAVEDAGEETASESADDAAVVTAAMAGEAMADSAGAEDAASEDDE